MGVVKISAATAAVMSLTLVPAYAGQRGNSGNHGPSTPHGRSAASHGPSTHTSGAPATPPGQAAKSPKSTTDTSTTSPSNTATTGTSTSPTTIDFSAGPVAQKLSKNTALTSKLATRLKALGYAGSVDQAAYGFRNIGQFVAATNVSQNLGIPFEQLKLQMTGLTVDASGKVLEANRSSDGTITMVDPSNATSPAPTKSLGQAIQTVKSDVDATAAANTATTQANTEIQNTTTSESTTTKKKSTK